MLWLSHSVQFSRSVLSDSLWPRESQHTRPLVHHQLPESTQTHVHRVDAIQPSHPLLSPSPPAVNHSQPQGLFQRVGSSHQVAKILELQLSALPVNIRLIPCRIDWFDLLTKGLLRLLQHHNSKASKPILYSYPYKSPNSRIPPLGINGFGEAG